MPAKKDYSIHLTTAEVRTWALDQGYSAAEAQKLADALLIQNKR